MIRAEVIEDMGPPTKRAYERAKHFWLPNDVTGDAYSPGGEAFLGGICDYLISGVEMGSTLADEVQPDYSV